MFFGKKEDLDESTLALIGIAVATRFRHYERKNGRVPDSQIAQKISEIREDAIKKQGVKPSKQSHDMLMLICTALSMATGDGQRFVDKMTDKVEKGDPSITQPELDKAMEIAVKELSGFSSSIK
ncbi:hypothetical protein G6662_09735 [Polynucleobacter paneuropaeus]|jgi:hypothetical protein|nr:hypothetical protein [Polynucleobacter paneuropaeus]